MALALSFSYQDAEIILNWYENSKVKSERFGSSRYYFPQEEFLIEKLNKNAPNTFFDEMDVEIIMGWMEKSMGPGIVKDKVYFPLEKEIISKLKRAKKRNQTKLKNGSEIKRETAIEYADRLIYEKNLEQEKEQQRNLRQQLLQDKIKAKKEEQNKQKISTRIKSHLEKFFYFGTKKNHE